MECIPTLVGLLMICNPVSPPPPVVEQYQYQQHRQRSVGPYYGYVRDHDPAVPTDPTAYPWNTDDCGRVAFPQCTGGQ